MGAMELPRDYIGRRGSLDLEGDDGERCGDESAQLYWTTGISTSMTCGDKQVSQQPASETLRSSFTN
jgi:hypothetical protein